MTSAATRRSASLNAYKQAEATRSWEERDQEILRHLPLVHKVVERILSHLPPHVERDDLFNAGVIGLMDAIDRFDASRNNAFSTYAVLRIRGAVIDELRSRDWIPRGARARAKEYHQAVHDLTQELGSIPDDHHIAERLGISIADLPDVEKEAALVVQVSLESPVGEEASLRSVLADRHEDPFPGLRMDRADQQRILRDVLSGLKDQERLVIKLYYFEGLLMKEIAKVLDLTESRICQIHSRLLAVLRLRLQQAGLADL